MLYHVDFLRKLIFWDHNFSNYIRSTESFIIQSSFANECLRIPEKSESFEKS